jgi:hypothetical protein
MATIETVSFEKAIQAIKSGKKAKRKDWDNKKYIILASNIKYKDCKGIYEKGYDYEFLSHTIALVQKFCVRIGWSVSLNDTLANDWIIF